jgi:hypothetical protein
MFIHNTGDADAAVPPTVDVPELAPDASRPAVDGEEAPAQPTTGGNTDPVAARSRTGTTASGQLVRQDLPAALKSPRRKATHPASDDRDTVSPAAATTAVLMAYDAWYCTKCSQRRHDPGTCPDCHSGLLPVHVLIVLRELT